MYGSYYGEVFKGYFYAPVTGNYIFRGMADDSFALYVSSVSGTTNMLNPNPLIYDYQPSSSKTNLYIAHHSTALGDSTPLSLQAGSYYYMEAYHINLAGTGLFYIEAEVPNTNSNKLYQSHEVNKMQIIGVIIWQRFVQGCLDCIFRFFINKAFN